MWCAIAFVTAGWIVLQVTIAAAPPEAYDDFSWIKNWAAIGDSFTAGIGSGSFYSKSAADKKCARYDYTYPAIMNRFFGNSVKNFTYLACSGDTTEDILRQIEVLPPGQDLVVMTAGGNDLCLSTLIGACILSPITNDISCQHQILTAQNYVDGILAKNIRTLLDALNEKMNIGGVVVFSYYARYFDTQTDECERQNWRWPISIWGLRMTRALRRELNELVESANAALKIAVEGWDPPNRRMVLIASDWDPWVTLRGGRMCMPGSSGKPDEPGLMFYKLDTSVASWDRQLITTSEQVLGNLTAAVAAQAAEQALRGDGTDLVAHHHNLTKRTIIVPFCGEDDILKNVVVFLFADKLGKIFHPNAAGHETMASFALDAVRQGRARVLGVSGPGCPVNELTCARRTGSRAYATPYPLYSNTAKFCKTVADNVPPNSVNWFYQQTYNANTPDENRFKVELSNGAWSFDEDKCNHAVNRILDGCDHDGDNPLNWKSGGTLIEGSYKYTILIARNNRPWPPPKRPTQICSSSYRFFWDDYDIYGAGWASWDRGEETLKPNTTKCIGWGGLTNWNFKYYDGPDEDGMEWHAWFRTPIWTRRRCYDNNKVQEDSDGPWFGGCRGSG